MSSKLTDPGIVQLSSMPLTTLVYLVDPATPLVSNKMTLADFFFLMRLALDSEVTMGIPSETTTLIGSRVSLRGAVDEIAAVTDDGLQISRPFCPEVVIFSGAGMSTAIEAAAPVSEYIYACTDSAPIDIFDPTLKEFSSLRITNISDDPVVVSCAAAPTNSFIDATTTPVNSLTIAPGQSVTLTLTGDFGSTKWTVTGRTVSASSSGGDVVGPTSAVDGNIAVFDSVTGKLLKDAGIEALESVSTSGGATDAGKLAVLGGAGQFDPSFLPATGGDMLAASSSAIAITGATTLTIGRWHVFTGTSSDYAATLPSAASNADKFVGIIMGDLTALSKRVTITGAGGDLINGSSTRVMWANETAVLRSDGTGWEKVAGRSLPMLAVLSLSADQGSVATLTETKVNLDTSNVDPTGAMCDTGSGKVNILRSASYHVTSGIRWAGLVGDCPRLIGFTRKNATPFQSAHTVEISGLNGALVSSGTPSPANYAAGDFLELFGLHTSPSTQSFAGRGSTDATSIQVSEVLDW